MSKTVMVSKTADKTVQSVKNTTKPKPKIVKNGIMEVMFGPGPKKKNDLVFTSPNAKTDNMYEYEVDAKGNVVSKSGKMDMSNAQKKYEAAQYSPKYGHVLWAFNDHDLGKKLDSAHAAHILHSNPKSQPVKKSIKRNGSKFCVISKTGGFDCFDSISEAIENKSVGAIILRDDDFKKINSLRGKLLYDKACEISKPNASVKSNPSKDSRMLKPNKQSDYFWHECEGGGGYSYCFVKDGNTYCNAVIDSISKKCTYVIFEDGVDYINCADVASAKRIIENRFKGKQSIKSNPTNISEKIATCFRAGKKCKIGDTETDGTSIFLYGKKIVSKRADGIYVTNAGSDSKLTKDRLSPFCKLSVKADVRMLNGKAWDGAWKKLTDLDSGGFTKVVGNPKPTKEWLAFQDARIRKERGFEPLYTNTWETTEFGWQFGSGMVFKKTDKGYGYNFFGDKARKKYTETLAEAKRAVEAKVGK